MHPFATYVLRSYFRETGWNEDNLYSNLTRSSAALLDFTLPHGLNFTISKSPTSLFKTTYSMTALPTLNGSVGYIFTSCDLNVQGSANVPFKQLVEKFRVHDRPIRPAGKEEVWLAGKRADSKDYLLYGRLYIPAGRLDALYSIRLSSSWQAIVAAISDPRSRRQYLAYNPGNQLPQASLGNVMLSLQQDTGKWCTEYTWSGDDEMFGLRVLHNFGGHGTAPVIHDENGSRWNSTLRVDEEEAMEGGLKGRISAGAELYFSAKEKSAGVSTGVRFTTMPDATPPSFQLPDTTNPNLAIIRSNCPTGPPTTITAVFNPMMGHLSGAYASRVARNLTMGTRFDFNIYSYESEWTMGLEWWLRRSRPTPEKGQVLTGETTANINLLNPISRDDEVQGVVKFRASTNTDVGLMWEGRLKNVLVSLGVSTDLSSRSKPIRSIGLEVAYFSSGD